MKYVIKPMLRLYRKLIPQSRAIVLMGLTAVICFLILTVCFPHPFFFIKLVLGLLIGTSLVDLLSPKLGDPEVVDYMKSRRGRYEMLLITPVAIVFTISLFVTEENFRAEIRQLTPREIASIDIVVLEEGKNVVHRASPESVAEFCRLCRSAEQYHESHDVGIRKFELKIQYADGRNVRYEARVSETHKADIVFDFRSVLIMDKMIIPGGRQWLDKIAPEH